MGIRTGKPRGRPAGAKSKATRKREADLKAAAIRIESAVPGAFTGDSHELLMAVYKDVTMPWPMRLDAAKAAISYEKPRLAAVEHSGNQDKPLSISVVSGVIREDAEEHVNGDTHSSH